MKSSGFAELAARSHYSFLEGSSSPRELVAVAAGLGIEALGLCDRNGLYGAVGFVAAAQAAGIHPVVGAELDLVGGARLRLLARDPSGYHQLCRAISAAQLAGEKGQPLLDLGLDDPSPAAESATGEPPPAPPRRRPPTLDPPERPAALRPTAGPFPSGWPGLPSQRLKTPGPAARLDPAELSGCTVLAGGPDSAIVRALIAGDRRGAARRADHLREAFGRDRTALLLTQHLHPADSWLVAETAALAGRCGLPLVASNTPVHATTGKKPLLDVLTAIRHRTTLEGAAAHGLLLPNTEHRLKSERELRALLGAHPEAFDHAAHLARQCRLSLDFSDVRFPGFAVPTGETPFSVLYGLCQEALPQRYRPITSAVAARLQRELHVIEKTGLAEFFLIVHDIMRFARERGIPGQGRGSAADSIVAYLLGITRVDPVAHDLLFERFLHEDHQGTPDIDIDFSTEHREDVIQYVYERYGAERTGMVANIVTFRPRMSVRQVGAAFGFPDPIIDRLAKSVDSWIWAGVDEALKTAGLDHLVAGEATRNAAASDALSTAGAGRPPAPRQWELFLDMCAQIEGTPRHLGIHVGGMLVTGRPLVEVAPVERASMPGRVVVQFNKDDVEDLGLIKMDLLGLRTLGMIADCLDMVAQQTGARPDLDALALDDPAVYDSICAPDTIGLFQIESRAQQQALYQSQPAEFNDLIVQVAIIRPGPIQGNAVHPYLRRRQGLEPVTYLHPSLEPILADTRGVVLYQEQILRI
ncbi:MAG TPA: PHP domain-containing protein, partial [Candidatus Dormibacteraeota bacterium]